MTNGMNVLLDMVKTFGYVLLGAALGHWYAYRMYLNLSEHEFIRQTRIRAALCFGLAVLLAVIRGILEGYLETSKP